MDDLERIKSDFRVFLWLVWKHLNLPNPTPVQHDIASYIQNGPRRSIVMAYRGVGKSWITSAFVVWTLLNDPQQKIMVVSASKERADAFTTFTRRLISEIDILKHLEPNRNQRDSKISFDVGPATADHSPSVKSVGITGQLTGSRADIIIGDDIEVPSNSATEGMRVRISELVKEFDAILKPGGRVLYLGTPQTEMSLYNKLPDRNYQVRIWPARIPDEERLTRYGERLSPFIYDLISKGARTGDPVDPSRFDDEDLMEREASYGRSGFALQFMLDTSLSDAERYPLKVADLIFMSVDGDHAPEKVVWGPDPKRRIEDVPNVAFDGDFFYRQMEIVGQYRPYTGSLMVIDPSGRGKDETAVCVSKVLNAQIFVPELKAYREGYTDATLEDIARMAKKHQVNRIRIESNFGDGMFAQLLRPYLSKHWPCTLEDERSVGQKELRIIDALEPVMNQHRLIIDPSVLEWDWKSVQHLPTEEAIRYQLIYQLTRITRDRGALSHDDRLDALAMAVSYWVRQMALDQDAAIADRGAEDLLREVEMLMDNTKPGWRSWALDRSRETTPYAPGHEPDEDGNWLNLP